MIQNTNVLSLNVNLCNLLYLQKAATTPKIRAAYLKYHGISSLGIASWFGRAINPAIFSANDCILNGTDFVWSEDSENITYHDELFVQILDKKFTKKTMESEEKIIFFLTKNDSTNDNSVMNGKVNVMMYQRTTR